jgi:hypothetical protein
MISAPLTVVPLALKDVAKIARNAPMNAPRP